jgi:hypothetical protein
MRAVKLMFTSLTAIGFALDFSRSGVSVQRIYRSVGWGLVFSGCDAPSG